MQYLQDFKKTLELREQLLTYINLRAQKYTCYGEAVDPSSIDRYMNYENSFFTNTVNAAEQRYVSPAKYYNVYLI